MNRFFALLTREVTSWRDSVVTFAIRRCSDLRSLGIATLAVTISLSYFVVAAEAQNNAPRQVEVDVPFEMLAPWYSRDRSEVEDQVMLRGTLHVTTRTWQTSPNRIDRFFLHANAVDIHGTSETTGQRFRVNGSFSYDLPDPEVTFNPDGTFNVPMQTSQLRIHKVDPQPAQATATLAITNGATGAAVYSNPLPPATVGCQRIYAPDGSATPSINCGTLTFTYFATPAISLYRVFTSGGSACTPGTLCIVPDGATLFNGYTGDYNIPLTLLARVFISRIGTDETVGTLSARWHCRTGSREVPIVTSAASSGIYFSSCRPFYSGVDPIEVWLEHKYTFFRYQTYGPPLQEVTLIVNERPFTFRMDERETNAPPTVQGISVKARARSASDRCAMGALCELVDGDSIFNTQDGDFELPLVLQATASDPEGDPLSVEWVCTQNGFSTPVTYISPTEAQCSGFSFPSSTSQVEVYARVSDGESTVESPKRRLVIIPILH